MTPDELLDLAKRADRESRGTLFQQITDLFLADEVRLSDRERALMGTIMRRLVVDVERTVRAELADRLKTDPAAPPEIVELLAADDAEIAVPLLFDCGVLRDHALIEIVRDRSREHAIAVAGRRGISEEVADKVVDRAAQEGDTELLETLARNADATLSRRAAEYLVAEARRVDSLHGPLVDRADLPPDLSLRLYWWVAAGLKKTLLERFTLDEIGLHEAIEDSVTAAVAGDATRASLDAAARRVLDKGGRESRGPRAIIGYVRADRSAIAVQALAQETQLPREMVRHCLLQGPMEGLAVLCREAGFGRDQFVALLGIVSPAWPGGQRVLPPGRIAEAASFFDQVTDAHARRITGYWRSDPGFRRAEAEIAGIPSR